MFTACLLACLALGLAAANPTNPTNPGIRCSSIKPLPDLNITEVQGDWVILRGLRFMNGVRMTPRVNFMDVLNTTDVCVHLHIDANSSDSFISGKMWVSFMPPNQTMSLQFEVEKGVWHDRRTQGHHMMVISASPDNYLVGVGCMKEAVRSEAGADVTEHTVLVMVAARFDPESGRSVLGDQELEDLLQTTSQELGVDNQPATVFKNQCVATL